MLILSAPLELHELCGQVFGGTEHYAAYLRIGFEAPQKRCGTSVVAYLGNEEDDGRVSVGLTAKDVPAVANGGA